MGLLYRLDLPGDPLGINHNKNKGRLIKIGIIQKIGKAKAKYTAWQEEKEQKELQSLKIQAKMSKEYLKRDAEKRQLKTQVAKAKEAKFKNSFLGKAIDGMEKFDKAVNKPSSKIKKGKKGKTLPKRKDYDFFGGDPY